MSYRILLTGSRNWADVDRLAWELGLAVGQALKEGHPHERVVLVHGACPTGADAIADRLATDYGLTVERHAADWETFGKAAGPLRNQQMVAAGAKVCLAFRRTQNSRGTNDCIDRALKAGIRTVIIEGAPEPEDD